MSDDVISEEKIKLLLAMDTEEEALKLSAAELHSVKALAGHIRSPYAARVRGWVMHAGDELRNNGPLILKLLRLALVSIERQKGFGRPSITHSPLYPRNSR